MRWDANSKQAGIQGRQKISLPFFYVSGAAAPSFAPRFDISVTLCALYYMHAKQKGGADGGARGGLLFVECGHVSVRPA